MVKSSKKQSQNVYKKILTLTTLICSSSKENVQELN